MIENDRDHIIELIKSGEKLPKEYIYKRCADAKDDFLFRNGRKEKTCIFQSGRNKNHGGGDPGIERSKIVEVSVRKG